MNTTAMDTRNGGALAERMAFAEVANQTAAMSTFAKYRAGKAQNTLRRQDAELATFGAYVNADALGTSPAAWQGVTWGIVESFTTKLLNDSYAVGTINNHLSTIKTYARLAAKAGELAQGIRDDNGIPKRTPAEELAMIRMVSGYGHQEGKNLDKKRESAGMGTRIGSKKAEFRALTEDQEAALKAQCDGSPQGLRDRAMLVLLLDLGLRVSEAADLRRRDFDAESGKLAVYRRKTDNTTTFELRNGKAEAMRAYIEAAQPEGQLMIGSRKGGAMTGGMSERAIRARVQTMGAVIGIPDLSPHDLRHTRATRLASCRNVRELMDWFGWNSPAMAARYIESVQFIPVE